MSYRNLDLSKMNTNKSITSSYPIAESTYLEDTSKTSSSKFPWGGKVSSKRKGNTSPSLNIKHIQQSNFLSNSFVAKASPQVYIDAQSDGLASRIVMYSEQNAKKQKPLSNQTYSRSGEYPLIHFDKTKLPYKPRRNFILSSNKVKIAAPIKSTFEANARSEIFRSGHLSSDESLKSPIAYGRSLSQGNEPLSPTQPLDDTDHGQGTRSVLDALKEISRKRIHCTEPSLDNVKKLKDNQDDVDSNSMLKSLGTKRHREAAASSSNLNLSIERQQKRICTKNNDILSSLSSSTPVNVPSRKIPIDAVSSYQNPNEMNQQTLDTILAKKLASRTINNETVHLNSLQEIPTKSIDYQFEEPTITLFNKRHDIAKFNKISSPVENDDEEESISFIKPKDDLPESSFPTKGHLNSAEKSKLQLMMSWLSGDLSDNEDEIDAGKLSEKKAENKVTEKSSLTIASIAETSTTKTSTTSSFPILPTTVLATNILDQSTVITTTTSSLFTVTAPAAATSASATLSFTPTTSMFTVPKSTDKTETKYEQSKPLLTSVFKTASTTAASDQLERNDNPIPTPDSTASIINQNPPKSTFSFGLTTSAQPLSTNITSYAPTNTTTSLLTNTSTTVTSTSIGHRLGGFSFSPTSTTPTMVSTQKDLSPIKSVLPMTSSAPNAFTQQVNSAVSSVSSGFTFTSVKASDSEVGKPIFSFGNSTGSSVAQSQMPSNSLNFGQQQQQKSSNNFGSASSTLALAKPATSAAFFVGQQKTEQPSQPINSSSGPKSTDGLSSTTSTAQLFTFGNQTTTSTSSNLQTAFSFGNQVVPSFAANSFGATPNKPNYTSNDPDSQAFNSFGQQTIDTSVSTTKSRPNVFDSSGANKPIVFPVFAGTQVTMKNHNPTQKVGSTPSSNPSENVESKNLFGTQSKSQAATNMFFTQSTPTSIFSNTISQSQTTAAPNVFGSASTVTTTSSTLFGGIKSNANLVTSSTANTTATPFRFGGGMEPAIKPTPSANIFSMPTKSTQQQQSQPIAAQQSAFGFGSTQPEPQPHPSTFQAAMSSAPSVTQTNSNLFALGASTHTKVAPSQLFGNSSTSAFEPAKPFVFGTGNNNTHQQLSPSNLFSGPPLPAPPAFTSSPQFSFGATASSQTAANPNLGLGSPIQPAGNNLFNPVTPSSGARRIRQATRRYNK